MPLRPVIVSMSPPDYPLSMVASPQCRFRFARQSCSAAATSAANFRIACHPSGIRAASSGCECTAVRRGELEPRTSRNAC